MITIIHGDDISGSRNYFQELKNKQNNVISFGFEKISITDLVQNIEGSSLFGDTKTISIEDILTKFKKTDNKAKEIIDFVVSNSKKSTFILWESKEISKRDLLRFKDATIKIFKLPKNIFLFLDNIKPNNTNLLKFFHDALNSDIKEELILFMIQRQIRLLLSFCHSELVSESQIDEVMRLAPWQRTKLEVQAKLFSETDLKKIYKKLYEIEIGQKTGSLNLSLIQAIDFLLLEI